MREAGRLSAALDILTALEARPRPVSLALKEWGTASRYAGAKDRAFVSGLVLDVLRKRRSAAWRMGADTPRAALLGALCFSWDWPIQRIAEAAAEPPHAMGALTAEERVRLEEPRDLAMALPPVRGDYPDWLDGPLARVYGEARAEETAALANRAPVDLRVNRLKAEPGEVLAALADLGVSASGHTPDSLRLPAPEAAERTAPIEAHPVFLRGLVEVQDAGSQVAAALAGDLSGGANVLDYCAGGGGKTLALAAAMRNQGHLYAYDSDPRRMRDIIPRADRAGVTNLDLRSPLNREPLKDLKEAMDLVFVDAPCTGTGTWRRHPDTKWRMTPQSLERRLSEQVQALDAAAGYVKRGGRLIYATCSVLAEEDEDQVQAFLARRSDFRIRRAEGFNAWRTADGFLRLSPRDAATDGFFAAVLERTKDSG